ncbi:MAG TPA: DUF4255 domain-containing protein [Steroidobacteraceae bacterium]|nr:DUF4255 domain-containing protein [Steroidobacteraceae bacterium]
MSSYLVIAAVSEALRRVLWSEFEPDAVIRPIVGSEAAIVFRNPTETARDAANRLSLWLYHINENEFLKNQALARGNGPETQQFPPLALNLFYLITPFAPSGEADHMLLGKTMQVLYDNATILLSDPANNVFEELRVVLCNLPLDQLSRVWDALREPYRLSICYEIRVTRVNSQRMIANARVVERNAGFMSGGAGAMTEAFP